MKQTEQFDSEKELNRIIFDFANKMGNKITPKYYIGQEVYFFRDGKLVERNINKIDIEITKETFSVKYGFQDFREGLNMTESMHSSLYEKDLFASKQEFIDKVLREGPVFPNKPYVVGEKGPELKDPGFFHD